MPKHCKKNHTIHCKELNKIFIKLKKLKLIQTIIPKNGKFKIFTNINGVKEILLVHPSEKAFHPIKRFFCKRNSNIKYIFE